MNLAVSRGRNTFWGCCGGAAAKWFVTKHHHPPPHTHTTWQAEHNISLLLSILTSTVLWVVYFMFTAPLTTSRQLARPCTPHDCLHARDKGLHHSPAVCDGTGKDGQVGGPLCKKWTLEGRGKGWGHAKDRGSNKEDPRRGENGREWWTLERRFEVIHRRSTIHICTIFTKSTGWSLVDRSLTLLCGHCCSPLVTRHNGRWDEGQVLAIPIHCHTTR